MGLGTGQERHGEVLLGYITPCVRRYNWAEESWTVWKVVQERTRGTRGFPVHPAAGALGQKYGFLSAFPKDPRVICHDHVEEPLVSYDVVSYARENLRWLTMMDDPKECPVVYQGGIIPKNANNLGPVQEVSRKFRGRPYA